MVRQGVRAVERLARALRAPMERSTAPTAIKRFLGKDPKQVDNIP